MKKFTGKNTHRISQNPNTLSEDGGKTLPNVSEYDEMIAATIIQWLGSPVGQSVLCNMFFERERITR